jgi:NADH:ubiquinone oxidoreductase subunit 2 (chain N)
MMEIMLWSLIAILGGLGLIIPTIDYVKGTRTGPYLALLATLLATLINLLMMGKNGTLFDGSLRVDPLSTYISIIASLGAFLVVLASLSQAKDWNTSPSLYSLILLSLLGVYFILYVNDVSVLIAGWALVAVASYAIVGMRKDYNSLESSAKYALMGVTSSSLMVLGLALVTGTIRTSSLSLSGNLPTNSSLLVLGILILVAAFGFKMGVVPFHGWLPDVYGGAHPLLVSLSPAL